MTSKRITVEPGLFMFNTAMQISGFLSTNLLLQKACHPELTEEPDPSLKCEEETIAQKLLSDINTWKPILDCTLASLFVIFIGQWSDTHGKRRKPMLIIPIIGEIICLLFLLVSVHFWRLSPQLTALLTIIRSLTGGCSCVVAASIIYISDITTEEERTIRVGIMQSMMFLGYPVGTSLSGFLRSRINFHGTLMVCIVMNVIALFLTVTLVKNSAVEKTELKVFEGLFYPKNIIENFKVLVKKRDDSRRLVLILTFLVTPLYIASECGEYSVVYLYARSKFSMDEVEYAYFSSLKPLVTLVGIIPTGIFFFWLFKVTDQIFGLIGSVTQIISGLCCAMVQNQWQFLAVSLLEPIRGVVTVTSKSLLTKVVDPCELGRVTSLQSALDTFIPIFTIPLYSKFYNLTFEFMPGAFFLLNSCIAVVLLLFYSIILFVERKKNQDNPVTINDTTLSKPEDMPVP